MWYNTGFFLLYLCCFELVNPNSQSPPLCKAMPAESHTWSLWPQPVNAVQWPAVTAPGEQSEGPWHGRIRSERPRYTQGQLHGWWWSCTTQKYAQRWKENHQQLQEERGYLPMSNCINIYLLLIAQPAAKGSCIKHQLAHSTTGFFFGGCQKRFGWGQALSTEH